MFILSPILPGSLYILLRQARERHVVTTSAQDFYSAVATTTKTLIYILSYGICPAWPRCLALDLPAINVEPAPVCGYYPKEGETTLRRELTPLYSCYKANCN